MSEVPPPNSPEYVAYPRPAEYGWSDRLQALADGYFGLNWIFLVNVLLAIGTNVVVRLVNPLFIFVAIPVMFVLIGLLTYPHNKRIGYGKGWTASGAVIASVLMGLNSALCCGIIGYVVMQTIAGNEMKKYGVKSGFLGFKKKDIQARIAELQGMESGQIPVPPSA